MINAKIATKLTLTVKRPNGVIEHVVHPTLKAVTEAQFKQIQEGTRAAGRGEVIDYKIDYRETKAYRNTAEAMAATRKMGDVEAAMTLNGKSK